MKTHFTTILILLLSISFAQFQPTTCSVVAVYEKKPANGLKVIDLYGIKKPDYYLSEINLDEGIYELELNRIDQDFYEVPYKNIIIETQYCYEYPSYKKSILTIESGLYGSSGYLVFPK